MGLIEVLAELMQQAQMGQYGFPAGRGLQRPPGPPRPVPVGGYQPRVQQLDQQRRAVLMQMHQQAMQGGGGYSTPVPQVAQSAYTPNQQMDQMMLAQKQNQMAQAYQQQAGVGYAPPVQNPAEKLAMFQKAQQLQNYLPVQPPAY